MKHINNEEFLKTQLQKNNIKDCFTNFEKLDYYLVRYQKEEMIIRANSPLKNLLFILDGKIKIYSINENGSVFITCYAEGFGFLGDVEFTTRKPANENVEAITSVLCLVIPMDKNIEILENDITFNRFVSRSLAEKMTYISSNSHKHKFQKAENRLAAYLILNSSDDIVHKKLNEISETVGISYRHLLRMLKGFCEKEYLQKGNCKGVYVIKNREKLQELARELI